LKKCLGLLMENPWMTYQVCNILSLLDSEMVEKNFFRQLILLVLDGRFNIFAYQNYLDWLLLAYHKLYDKRLREFAINQIEKSDQTNEAGVSEMIIYMCSIDRNFDRVINRKFSEGKYSHSYFQSRLALIAQRKLETTSIPKVHIHPTLTSAPLFTNSFKNKDLVPSPRDNAHSED